jgi:hypothetical protein
VEILRFQGAGILVFDSGRAIQKTYRKKKTGRGDLSTLNAFIAFINNYLSFGSLIWEDHLEKYFTIRNLEKR